MPIEFFIYFFFPVKAHHADPEVFIKAIIVFFGGFSLAKLVRQQLPFRYLSSGGREVKNTYTFGRVCVCWRLCFRKINACGIIKKKKKFPSDFQSCPRNYLSRRRASGRRTGRKRQGDEGNPSERFCKIRTPGAWCARAAGVLLACVSAYNTAAVPTTG